MSYILYGVLVPSFQKSSDEVKDPNVVWQAVKRLLASCASRDVTMMEVEKGEHELFMGKHWMSVTTAMTEWMHKVAQRREEVLTS